MKMVFGRTICDDHWVHPTSFAGSGPGFRRTKGSGFDGLMLRCARATALWDTANKTDRKFKDDAQRSREVCVTLCNVGNLSVAQSTMGSANGGYCRLLRLQCCNLTVGRPPSATFRGRGMPRFSVTVRSVRHRPSGLGALKWLLQRCRRRPDEGGARLLPAERYAHKCKFGLSTSSQKRRKVSTFG